MFVKVVRPRKVADLVDRYERVAHLATVPRIDLVDVDLGVVVFHRVPGKTLRRSLLAGDPVPTASHLDDALAPLWVAGLVHGDLNDANVLVEDGAVTGVVDLDRSGAGVPDDDRATLLAHLDALAIYRPADAAIVGRYRLRLSDAWGEPPQVRDVRRDLAQRASDVGRHDESLLLRARNEATPEGRLGDPSGESLSRRAW
jgi:hypothetical protein